jgi:hypothetical protein
MHQFGLIIYIPSLIKHPKILKYMKNQQMHKSFHVLLLTTHHVTKHNTPIHNILSTVPQLCVSQKALRTLP